jgi:hypothetical protein
MPRRPKKAHELTTDEAIRKIFPKKVRERAECEGLNARKTKEKVPMKRKTSS